MNLNIFWISKSFIQLKFLHRSKPFMVTCQLEIYARCLNELNIRYTGNSQWFKLLISYRKSITDLTQYLLLTFEIFNMWTNSLWRIFLLGIELNWIEWVLYKKISFYWYSQICIICTRKAINLRLKFTSWYASKTTIISHTVSWKKQIKYLIWPKFF